MVGLRRGVFSKHMWFFISDTANKASANQNAIGVSNQITV